MIRNADTFGAYSIRPYPDGRKELYLRSIWGYEKLYDPFLIWKMVMRNWLSLYLDRKRIMRKGKTIFLICKMFMQNRLYLYWNRERVMQNVLTFYLNRKRVMQNGRKGFREHVFERCFWGTYFEGAFSFVTKRKHSGFVVKSGVRNRKGLFEEVYSSSPSRMAALNENKQ